MSQFVTIIPCDIEPVKRLLPAKSFVESVQWNPQTQSVELVWSNQKLVTPLTIPVPFTMQMLHDKEIPKNARIIGEPQHPQQTDTISTETVTVSTDNVKEQVDKRRKKGVKVGQAQQS